MNELQSRELIMFKELKKILNDNNIRYFAIGGTAIGAFREKGFIPWDDDIDLAIFEEDVNRFKEIIKNSKFTTVNNRLNFDPFPFIKVFDNSTLISEGGYVVPLNIDIFIAQRKRVWTDEQWKRYKWLRYILVRKTRTVTKNFDIKTLRKNFFLMWLTSKIYFFISAKKYEKEMSDLLSSLKIDDTESSSIRYCYQLNRNDKFDVSSFTELQFEDTTLVVNTTFAKDTEWIFGDIMKKPAKIHVYNHEIQLLKTKTK